jgi:methylated-DNA-[protein]-cysteine S-methyltransferase
MNTMRETDAAVALQRFRAGDPSALSEVPVDLSSCTPFVRRVYEELRAVPPGETVTYGELARRAGKPKAARAVGRAMATNPFAPFVPCHRVLASDGRLTGFSAPGGIEAKRRLLEMEARWASERSRHA